MMLSAVGLLFAMAPVAFAAETTVEWEGQGDEHATVEDCVTAQWHFVLTPGGNAEITDASLSATFDDDSMASVEGTPSGEESEGAWHFHVQSDAETVTAATATVTHEGETPGGSDFMLVLSDSQCLEDGDDGENGDNGENGENGENGDNGENGVDEQPVSLTIIKVDQEDPGTTLADADFDLYLDDGDDTFEADQDALEGSGTTGSGGTLAFTGLTPNETYFVVETDAPEGYEPVTEVTQVELGESDRTITMENAPTAVAGVTVAVDLVKTADPQTVGVGDEVTYTYTFTNEGNVEITDVTLTDDVVGDISLPDEADPLAPGESIDVQVIYTVTSDDVGTLRNVAVLTGESEAGPVEDDAEAVVDVVEVAGVVEERREEGAAAEELAATGDEQTRMAPWGAALLATGAAVLYLTRRRLLAGRRSAER